MLDRLLKSLKAHFSKTGAPKTASLKAIASKVTPLACYFCKRGEVPLFRPFMEFWPNRNQFPFAEAVTVNMGRQTCAECQEKLAWHNLADRHLCETIAAAIMQRYGNEARPDFKATKLTWTRW